MKRTPAIVAVLASFVVLAGCSSPQGTSPTTASSAPASVSSPLPLVVIGDSIPYNSQQDCPSCRGFVSQYADALAKATGREVTSKNRSTHTGATLPDLMEDLPGLQDEITSADAIVVGIAHNSFPLNEETPCGSPVDRLSGVIKDWSRVNQACATASAQTYRPMYDELFSTVAGWRTGKPTILRTINRYNDWIGSGQLTLTPEEAAKTVVLHDAWNTMLCESAEASGFTCIDVYHAFNGPDGSKPSGDLLAADYTHPSQLGNNEIAKLLTAEGFAPLG